jgi:hypothetical protein
MTMPKESDTKLGRFIDEHTGIAMLLFGLMLILFVVGLGYGLANIGYGNMLKVIDRLPNINCDDLLQIPRKYSQWMSYGMEDYPTELYQAWLKEMERCK